MNVLVLQLLLGLQGCAEGINLCGQELCEYCRGILRRSAHDCDNLSVCEAHNITECFFSECATSSLSTPQSTTPTNAPIIAIGSLTGLLLVILVLVVTGWVWTCWTLKKKKEEIQHYKNCHKQESDSEEERVCPNQIYKMTTAQPVVGTAIEQPLDSLEESGQSINGLSSKDNKDHKIPGYHDMNRVENFYSSSEGSSHSSLQEEQRVNRVKKGDYSGEKHMYHVLEKSDGGVYEEPDKILEENTAMKHEALVPC